VNWTERILLFPVRTAAVADFLQDLQARGSADLNAVMTTFNDSDLCRRSLRHWVEQGWIVVSPTTPLHAIAGPAFSRDLTLRQFCGNEQPPEEAGEPQAGAEWTQEARSDDDS